MKKTVKTIIIAAMLATSPNAFAADLFQVAGGVALTAASVGWLKKEYSEADDSVAIARTNNCNPSCDRQDYVANGVLILGAIGALGGVALAISGFSNDKPDYFTRNGLVMDGMTLGYTDTGMVGLQKKWEF